MAFQGRRVFVTGGTGFIGNAVVRKLVEQGARVTCLVRPGSDAGRVERLGATVVRGDVTKPDTLDLRGHDLVIHGAAWVGFGIPEKKLALFRKTNVDGTRNVVDAAERAGVRKFVQLSSVAALGEAPRDELPVSEERVGARDAYHSEYERTKTESHLTVAHATIPNALPMPGLVLGPDGPFAWLVEALARGRIPVLPADDEVKGWVHVEDTADAILQCALKGMGPYVLVDENARLTDLMVEALEEAGLPVPRRRIPTNLLVAGAGAIEATYRLRGKTPAISRELVSKLKVPMSYNASRARKELGWRPELVKRLARDLLDARA